MFLEIDVDTSTILCDEIDNKGIDLQKLLWDKATTSDLNNYQNTLDEILSHGDISFSILQCKDLTCGDVHHKTYIEGLYNYLTDACIFAARLTIPSKVGKKTNNSAVLGWNAYVKDKQDKAIFWHNMWKSAGSPQHGVLADLRRSTCTLYHRAVKQVKQNQDTVSMTQIAESLYDNNVNNMWY